MDWPDLTLPPTTLPDHLKKQNPELELLYLALRKSDQIILDRLFEAVRQHQAAMEHASNLLPMEGLVMMIQLEERKWLRHSLVELEMEIRRLRVEIEELKRQPSRGLSQPDETQK
jgi:hypothetical protein